MLAAITAITNVCDVAQNIWKSTEKIGGAGCMSCSANNFVWEQHLLPLSRAMMVKYLRWWLCRVSTSAVCRRLTRIVASAAVNAVSTGQLALAAKHVASNAASTPACPCKVSLYFFGILYLSFLCCTAFIYARLMRLLIKLSLSSSLCLGVSSYVCLSFFYDRYVWIVLLH